MQLQWKWFLIYCNEPLVFKAVEMSIVNVSFQVEDRSGRITRARAKELSESGDVPCSSKSSGVQKHIVRANSKRMASDDINICSISSSGLPNKRRAVLKDVTNISTKGSDKNCRNASNIQVNLNLWLMFCCFFVKCWCYSCWRCWYRQFLTANDHGLTGWQTN